MNRIAHYLLTGIPALAIVMTMAFSEARSQSGADKGVVYVCLFSHNEDNLLQNLTSQLSKQRYLQNRQALVSFCTMLKNDSVAFNWESEWLFLQAALLWDSDSVKALTNGKNIVRYLKEDLHMSVDPHSHEQKGYNYADVAKLIDSLGVVPTAVIGGHVWDPASANFQHWERFKAPLAGTMFPWYSWKGDILIGSGTPNHVNDPAPSGVWRPTDPNNYWLDDPSGTVYAVGQYQSTVEGVQKLVDLYKTGMITPDKILTATFSARQGDMALPGVITAFHDTVVAPLLQMQARGDIRIVTFPELIRIFNTQYAGRAHLYGAPVSSDVSEAESVGAQTGRCTVYPNPASGAAVARVQLNEQSWVQATVVDCRGVRISAVFTGALGAGTHSIVVPALPTGTYFLQVRTQSAWWMVPVVSVR